MQLMLGTQSMETYLAELKQAVQIPLHINLGTVQSMLLLSQVSRFQLTVMSKVLVAQQMKKEWQESLQASVQPGIQFFIRYTYHPIPTFVSAYICTLCSPISNAIFKNSNNTGCMAWQTITGEYMGA